MTSLFDLPFEDENDTPAPADDAEAPPAAPRIYSVREITGAVRAHLEQQFPVVWVEGELSDCRSWQSGHVYFTLKDGDAQLQGVLFRTDAARLRFKPVPGLHVLVRGRLTIYPAKGQYQIVADTMEPRGAGALQLAFEQLKRRLQAEGLFDAARKRPLPLLPRRVGVVTSLDGAALRDILRVLRTRQAPVSVVISPTRVQGDGAAGEIARALRRVVLIDHVDVVIVGRGGGSAEDLWAFNEEIVARALVDSPVPVISAVGHEIDTTIADLAADVRAATPSQAAELVVRQAAEFSTRLETATRQLALGLQQRLERRRVLLLRLQQRPAFAHLRDGVVTRDRARHERALDLIAAMRGGQARRTRALEDLAGRLAYQHPRTQLTARLRRMVAIDSRLLQAGGAVATTRARQLTETARRLALCGPGADLATRRRTLDLARGRLQAAISTTRHRADGVTRALAGRLENLSPLRTLARGYAACWDATHSRLLRSTEGVAPGSAVHVQLADGELHCRVEDTSSSRTDTP